MSLAAPQYKQMFDYLRGPVPPTETAPVLAFGRNDVKVALSVGKLVKDSKAEAVVFTGGWGKDSGNLPKKGFTSEADFLAVTLGVIAEEQGLELPPVLKEQKATNGGENARLGFAVVREVCPEATGVILVAHATSMRRLGLVAVHESEGLDLPFMSFARVPTEYRFNPANPVDQTEAIAELKRIHEWPAKGWSAAPDEPIPQNLLDFAYDQVA